MAITYGSVINATLQNTVGKTKAIFQRSNALFALLDEKAGLAGSGGPNVRKDLTFNQSNFQRINGYQTISLEPQNSLDIVAVAPVEYVTTQGISRREELINRGENEIRDLWMERIEQTVKTMLRNLGADIYADGSVINQIAGLAYFIRQDPTQNATVAGINQATTPAWRNQVANGGTPVTDYSPQGFFNIMSNLMLNCRTTGSQVDLIMAGNSAFSRFESTLVSGQRYYGDERLASLGFDNVKFKVNVPVVADPGQCPDTLMYFLSTDIMTLNHYNPGIISATDKEPTNQLAQAIVLHWMGNLIVNDRSALGYLAVAS